jgi:hypothetical protein
MPNQNSFSEINATIPEICSVIYKDVTERAASTTKVILENLSDGKKNKVQRILGLFQNSNEKKLERLKLNFDLLIPYLVVAAVEIEATSQFKPYFRTVLDELIDQYHNGLSKLSGLGDVFDGDFFIRDPEERKLVLAELQRSGLSNISALPRMGLNAISDLTLERRFNEYRASWISDLMDWERPGFVASMPGKVYQHWSGNNPRNWESIQFNLMLFAGLTDFHVLLAKILPMTKLAMSRR